MSDVDVGGWMQSLGRCNATVDVIPLDAMEYWMGWHERGHPTRHYIRSPEQATFAEEVPRTYGFIDL